MNPLQDNTHRIFRKYLLASFGSALISAIYSVVDMAVVGQYQGPDGVGALAVVAPVWNIVYSLGILTGVGGSVLYSALRGSGKGGQNGFFTISMASTAVLAVAVWVLMLGFEEPVLRFFGADDHLLPLCETYLAPIRWGIPVFLLNSALGPFLRNDTAPVRATVAVLAGGFGNVFGDIFFVFGLDMGMFGAGLATMMGACLTLVVLLTHFFSRGCTLRFERTAGVWRKTCKMAATGFPTFFADIAMGILTILFNRQIMRYLNADALAVYGTIINVSTIVQCCGYAVGQAAQPLISINYGAHHWGRIRKFLYSAILSAALIGAGWTIFSELIPEGYIRVFMDATPSVLEIGPDIIRTYSLSFLLLPFNVMATYYFQAILRLKMAVAVSVLRGVAMSGAAILILPAVMGSDAIWYAMPLTECAVAVFASFFIEKYTKDLSAPRALAA